MLDLLKSLVDKVFAKLGYVPARSLPLLAPTPTGGQRGSTRRRQQLNEGFIASQTLTQPRPCTVRDLSHFGARVDLWESLPPAKLGAGVKLFLPCDGQEVDCEVAWIRGESVGLRFRSAFHDPTRTY